MADDHDQESKTEEASPRRLQQARDSGDVPLSRDAVGWAALAAGAVACAALAPAIGQGLVALVRASLEQRPGAPLGGLLPLAVRPALLALAACAAAAVAAVALTLAQTNFGLWTDKALPDVSRVFQTQRLTRLFGREFLVDLLFGLLKVAAVGAALWATVRVEFLSLGRMLLVEPTSQLAALLGPLSQACVKGVAVLGVMAGFDFALQRLRFSRKMRMTKDELRREAKEDEGDPLLRSRRKRRHRELLKGRATVEVPRADALLVNPTHIAIALRYRSGEDRAPRVTAKGKGQLAEHMRELARENGIPIYQDIPLARQLYRRVKVGGEVPASTYKAVAAVLAFVYRITGRAPGAATPGAAE